MSGADPVGQGWMALLTGAWHEARGAFEEGLKQGETPEALDGLAAAARWLDDADTALHARERAYRLFLHRGSARGTGTRCPCTSSRPAWHPFSLPGRRS